MTSRDPNVFDEDEVQSIRLALRTWTKRLWTAMPGVVQSYDPRTRRAVVQPATSVLYTDGTAMARSLVVDVPVMWPGTPRRLYHDVLEMGDPVMLVWSQRDIDNFKQSVGVAAPATSRVMSQEDAVAIPWGAHDAVDPAVDNALVMQTADGNAYIAIEDGRVTIKADAIRLEYDGGSMEYP